MKIAIEYRFKFKKDIFIDIVGYRRYGHNEQDQPAFTQPKMYEVIKNTKTAYDSFCEKIIEEGCMSAEEIKSTKDKFMKHYEEEYQKVIDDKF